MIFYTILFILILFFIVKYRIQEQFSNKKKKDNSLSINISKYISYNPILIYLEDQLYGHVADKLSTYNPFDKMKVSLTNYKILKEINNYKNLFGLVTLYDYLIYKKTDEKNNISSLGSIHNIYLTIVSKTFENLTDITNITISNYTGEQYLFNSILEVFDTLNVNIIDTPINLNNLESELDKHESVAFFMSHPNPKLLEILQKNFFLVDFDIPISIIENKIPNFQLKTLDNNDYKISKNIRCLSSYILIVTHNDTDQELVKKISRSIMVNFLDLKKSKNIDIQKAIVYFNKNELILPNLDITLHKGYHELLTEIGFITSVDNNICRKLVGRGGCEDEKIQPNPYRLL